jgi:hypothetical protein
VATTMPDELISRAENLGIPAFVLGRAGGDRFVVSDLVDLPLDDVGRAYDENLGQLLGDS